MSRLTSSTLSPEVMAIMLPMRVLIRQEFGQVLSLYDEEAVNKFCDYGGKSQNPKLSAMTQKLASLTAFAPAESLTSEPMHLKQVSSYFEQDSGHIVEFFDSADLKQPVCVSYGNVPPFVIDKPQRRCLLSSDLDALAPLGRAETSVIRLETLSPIQLMSVEQQSRSIPLETLWWFCGIQLSHGRLLPRLTTYHAFRLSRWPDFGTLPHERHHTKMATFLMKRPSALEVFRGATGVTQDVAVGFLNASSLCGWLQDEQQSSAAAHGASRPGLQGIIGKIRMRLGLGR